MKAGLVSISFRKLKPAEIIRLCSQCDLREIEWGGDVHVPLGDLSAAREVARQTREAGLNVCCYGSYVRMTREERPVFPALVDTARALGAPSIRVWAGKGEDADLDEIAQSTQTLCDMAKDMAITFEVHGGTLTHDAATAGELLRRIDRPNARSQWQPPVNLPEEDCLSSIAAMRPWLYHVHGFSWKGTDRLPLSAKAESWKKYLKALAGDRAALLEFVQDDEPQNLVRDAAVLHAWLRELAAQGPTDEHRE